MSEVTDNTKLASSYTKSNDGLFATSSSVDHHHTFSHDSLRWRSLQLSKAKLKASSRTSALLSGFAMIAMIELQIDDYVPSPLLIAFSICASLLVAVHMMALLISTCILPNLEAVSTFHHDYRGVRDSPHEKMRCYIDMAWAFSTGLGIFLFLLVVILQCWVKFWNKSKWAAGLSTTILVPVIVLFTVFAIQFYRQLISHKYERAANMMQELNHEMNRLSVQIV